MESYMGAVPNPSWRSNIPEDRSNKKSSCAQQLGFYSVLPADLGLSRVIDRVLPQRGSNGSPHVLTCIASTDLITVIPARMAPTLIYYGKDLLGC
jgi:hypothetical protein